MASNHSADQLTPKSQYSPIIEKLENEIMDDTKTQLFTQFQPLIPRRGEALNKVIDLNSTGSNRLEETVDELYTKVKSAEYK